jgi:hypothetical protein
MSKQPNPAPLATSPFARRRRRRRGGGRGPGAGSVSHPAAEYGRQHGITVIEGGCPCMFTPTADPGHKAMRLVFTLTGNVPRRVP